MGSAWCFPRHSADEANGGRCVLNIHAAPGDDYETRWRALLRAGLDRTREVGASVAHIALWPPYDRAPALVD